MISELIEKALEAREKAYAPYSKFKVGAAVLTAGGKIYTGCNVENASYPVGICAERVAMSKAVADGETEFTVIAIVGSGENYCMPCGMCRWPARPTSSARRAECAGSSWRSFAKKILKSLLQKALTTIK